MPRTPRMVPRTPRLLIKLCRVGGMNQDSFPVFNGYTVQFNSGIPSRGKSVVLSRFWFS